MGARIPRRTAGIPCNRALQQGDDLGLAIALLRRELRREQQAQACCSRRQSLTLGGWENDQEGTDRLSAAALCVSLSGPAVVQAAEDLTAKITAAKTAADHEALAAEFDKEAQEAEANAAAHEDGGELQGPRQDGGVPRRPALRRTCVRLSHASEAAEGVGCCRSRAAAKAAK